MSRKIQFHAFHLFFSLFSYLADKSGGWSMFVRPKLVIGGVIVGLGVGVHENIAAQNPVPKKKESIKHLALENKEDSILFNEDVLCYVIVEEMPEFPGGQEMLMPFLAKNIDYPKKAIKRRIEGMVVCQFVIKEDGTVTNVKVIKKVHPLLDKEAVRVIRSLPKWHPGKQAGKSVRCNYTLPIKFSLLNK